MRRRRSLGSSSNPTVGQKRVTHPQERLRGNLEARLLVGASTQPCFLLERHFNSSKQRKHGLQWE